MDAQDVCLALGISKRCLQNYRDNGLIPHSNVGGKFFYRETDIQETDQKEVKYGGDYHKGFGRVQGTGRMDKKSGESGGRGYGTDTPDSCGRALHDGR